MDELITLLRRGDHARVGEGLSRICPGLSLTTFDEREVTRATALREGGRGARVTSSAAAKRLEDGIARLREALLPATFVYAFDPIWHLGRAVRDAVGPGYRIAADVWAWQVPPGERGWPAHRGVSWRLDREKPQLLNTWVALSDVEVDRACMHFVPLDDDPAYPGNLASVAIPEGKAVAAPLSAGDALVWNANTLHWGGECAATARGPRVSCSFSLVREDAVERVGIPLADPLPRTLEERLDLIARQIVVYGEGQPDVRPEVLEWARATVSLAMYRPVTQRKAQ